MRIYCDSSALLKRSLEEPESAALETFLESRFDDGDALVTASLTRIEVSRAMRSRREALDPRDWLRYESHALSGVRTLPLDEATMALARTIGSPVLRSLDALHLAAAALADVDLLLTYDHRLADIALEMGIESSAPGSR